MKLCHGLCCSLLSLAHKPRHDASRLKPMLGILIYEYFITGGTLKTLWTFENQDKLEKFCSILKEQGIEYEIKSRNREKVLNSGSILNIDERDFEKAKKLLLKHRKRRTSIDKL